MNGLSNIKKGVKRSSAVILAALIIASGAESALISASAAEVTETASAASTLSNEDRGVIFANSRTDFRDESIYFLITTRFYDGDSSNNARTSEDTKAQNPENDPSWRGDFKGLIDKLDYIKALGFTAIWITPVVENDSGYDYHGYHAYDFSAVDTRYESNGVTYQTLIDACHAKGIKVIQDIVLNHTCNWGERNLLQITNEVYGGGRSKYVMPDGAALDPDNIYHHNGFCGGGDWDNQEAQKKTIADDCFDLNTENPTVYNYLIKCYTDYINMGVDGFRIDTVKHISRLTFNSVFLPAFKQAGGENFYMFGEVCTKGHDVWYRDNPPISTAFYTWADDASWTGRWSTDLASNEALLDEHYQAHMDMGSQPTSSNAFLNGNDYHTPDYSEKSGMDVIDFQMHWSFDSANQAFNTALGEDKYFNDSTWNVVYVDSHDYGPDNCQTLRYNGGTDAWAENLALMFTFRGIPCVYYGSEIEFQAGQPIDVGPNQPLSTTGRAYYGDHIEGTVATKDFTVFGNLSGEVKSTLNSTLSQHIMRLNRIRQAIPALRKGQYSTDGCSGNIAFKRRYTDSSTDSFACIAISGSATFTGVPNGTYIDAVTGDVQNVSGGTLTANCSGKGNMRVYVLDTAKTPAPGRVIPNGDYLTDGGSAEPIDEVPIPINDVDPTGITLDKSSLEVTEGKSATLSATIAPSNATKKTVTWTSSNTSVATVNGGKVTGVSQGTATITAETVNGYKATCKVTVKEGKVVKPTGITLNNSAIDVTVGGTDTLTATVTPSDADNKTVTWTSDNTSVATVSGGIVKGVSEGTAVITASTFNGFEASCTVTVSKPKFDYVDNGFYFEKPSGWGSSINVYFFNKSTNTQVGTAWPGTSMKSIGDGVYSLEYKNTDSNVVMIFNDGSNQSPGRDMGGFEIVDQGYYTSDGYKYTVKPEDPDVPVTSVTISKSTLSLEKGSTGSLTATVVPSNATYKNITWTSSNTGVAKVSSSGVVTAVAAGTATITAASSNGKTAACKVTVTSTPVVNDLVNNSTISATSINLGSSVTIKGAAAGGTTPYNYGYYYKNSTASTWTSLGTGSSATFKPTAAGTYNVKVNVVDSNSTVETKTFTVTVKANSVLTNTSTISATSVNAGTKVALRGAATGGTGSYNYGYYYKKTTASTWTKIGTGAYVTFTPAAGTYDVKVNVVDGAGTVATKTYTLTVKTVTPLANTSTISATTVNAGTKVALRGAATGGNGTYSYGYYYKKTTASTWTKIGTGAYVTFTPAAGTYNVKVNVVDAAGTVAAKTYTLTVKTVTPLTNTSTISAASVNAGTKVALRGAATGGSGTYSYGYYYKKTTASTWTKIGTGAYVTFTPAAGIYDVKVNVVDGVGTVAAKTYTLTVKTSQPLANSSTISAASITYGGSVVIKGAATGGTGSYNYGYYCKRSTATTWTKLGTGASATLKPSYTGNYDVKVNVVDGAGTVVTKTFTVVVKSAVSALVNNSTVSATTISAGGNITIKGAATGGSGTYNYGYYYKKSTATTWTKLGTGASAAFSTSTIGTYDLKINVVDGNGTIATKTYSVIVK